MSDYMKTNITNVNLYGDMNPKKLMDIKKEMEFEKLAKALAGEKESGGDTYNFTNSDSSSGTASSAATQQADPITSLVNGVSGIVGTVAKLAPVVGLIASL